MKAYGLPIPMGSRCVLQQTVFFSGKKPQTPDPLFRWRVR
jgi:hypothetical protein